MVRYSIKQSILDQLPRANLSASKRKKAVEIARDAIAQIYVGKLIPTTGSYVELADGDFDSWDDRHKDFRTLFQSDKNIKCNTCAIGSLFIASVDKFNGCNLSQVEGYIPSENDYLDQYFDPLNLRLMEFVFEGGDDVASRISNIFTEGLYDYLSYNQSEAYNRAWEEYSKLNKYAEALSEKYPDDKDRLLYLLKNLIRNNGEFVLPSHFEA